MNRNLVKIDVRKVHHKVFGHEAFQLLRLDHIELRVVLQTVQKLVQCALVNFPVLLETLHLELCVRERLVKLAKFFSLVPLFGF